MLNLRFDILCLKSVEAITSYTDQQGYNNNNNNDRLTAFDPGQPG